MKPIKIPTKIFWLTQPIPIYNKTPTNLDGPENATNCTVSPFFYRFTIIGKDSKVIDQET